MMKMDLQKQTKYGERLEEELNSMLEKYKQKYPCEGHEFMTFLQGGIPSDWESFLLKFLQSDPVDATRGYSEKCLNRIANVIPGLIGGSSNLASSIKVYLKEFKDF